MNVRSRCGENVVRCARRRPRKRLVKPLRWCPGQECDHRHHKTTKPAIAPSKENCQAQGCFPPDTPQMGEPGSPLGTGLVGDVHTMSRTRTMTWNRCARRKMHSHGTRAFSRTQDNHQVALNGGWWTAKWTQHAYSQMNRMGRRRNLIFLEIKHTTRKRKMWNYIHG